MNILHILGVENKKSNGATVAAIAHINSQARYTNNSIFVFHIRGESLPFCEKVHIITNQNNQSLFSRMDLAIFHEIYYPSFWKTSKIFSNLKIPYIVIPHGGLTIDAQSQKALLKKIVNLIWVNSFIKNAISIQFLSKNEKDNSLFHDQDSFIASNGIHQPNETKLSKDIYPCLSHPEYGITITYIGRFSIFYKGLDVLIDACTTIHQKMLDGNIHLNLYGPLDNPEAIKLQAIINEYKLNDIVCLYDAVFEKEKINILLNSDYFIQPSRSEGMPMGLLEAMSIGLPVIVSPGTGFAEIVKDNNCGFICKTDALSIAETILKVIKEKSKLIQMSENCISYIEKHFLWETVSTKTDLIYKEIVKKFT